MAINQTNQKINSYFVGALLGLSLILVFLILQPYLSSLLLAFVLAIIFRPVFLKIHKKTGKHDVLSAILTTALIIAIILVPFVIFSTILIRELAQVISSPDQLILHFSKIQVPAFWQRLNLDFKSYIQNLVNGFIGDIGKIFSNLAEFLVYLILTIMSLIYLFKDGHKIREGLLEALPFTAAQAQKLSDDMAVGIRAIIGGYLLVAIIQGLISGLGFWIFGVPNPALWGFITVFSALIPTFGTSLINIPAILYLFLNHYTGHAIGLAIWWITAISIIDNFIGPRFISSRVKIHVLLLIFSIIGGIKLFGTLGFIIGPLVMIFFWSILEMFREA